MDEILWNIKNGQDIRAALIELKAWLKKESEAAGQLYGLLHGDYAMFLSLLSSEDAKIRKNTAAVLGELARQEFLIPLFHAYQSEQTRFVRSTYLNSIKVLDYGQIRESLKKIQQDLSSEPVTEENKKHVSEELRILHDMLSENEIKRHAFCGWDEQNELVLLTNRSHIHCTVEELKELGEYGGNTYSAGVIVKTRQLRDIMQARTFQEMLFVVAGMKVIPKDACKAAEQIIAAGLVEFLLNRHKGEPPFYFRLEVKGRKSQEDNTKFVKKLAVELEHQSKRRLLNSVTHYEVELRLIENKEGSMNTLVKLFTLKDSRFAYRKKTIAAGMKPSLAALIVRLAKPYLKENAQVLDPFCGVGTLLIERDMLVKAGTMYGVDCFGEAVLAARENADAAHRIIHYINRDFFDFTHEYYFDEIVTDFPFLPGNREMAGAAELYIKFFEKARMHLKKDGILILYTHSRDLLKNAARKHGYKLMKEFEISMKEGAYLLILCS